ncbi:MAG: hypothetical protein P4L53_12440 [Candidatus Obscuribacterales bacterium]|nr:hypothetical protein [Candidatus Obscuribacterales bacterium]
MDLFAGNAKWRKAISHVQVFGMTPFFASYAKPDQLEKVTSFLISHNIALAVGLQVIPSGGPNHCGYHLQWRTPTSLTGILIVTRPLTTPELQRLEYGQYLAANWSSRNYAEAFLIFYFVHGEYVRQS